MDMTVRVKLMGAWLYECIRDNQLDVMGGFDEKQDMHVIYESIIDDLLHVIEYIKDLPDNVEDSELFEKIRGH